MAHLMFLLGLTFYPLDAIAARLLRSRPSVLVWDKINRYFIEAVKRIELVFATETFFDLSYIVF